MNVLGIIWLATFSLMFLFGKVTVNGERQRTLGYRFIGGIIMATVITLVLGLPLLGIISLI